jgi:hypothetical protein
MSAAISESPISSAYGDRGAGGMLADGANCSSLAGGDLMIWICARLIAVTVVHRLDEIFTQGLKFKFILVRLCMG